MAKWRNRGTRKILLAAGLSAALWGGTPTTTPVAGAGDLLGSAQAADAAAPAQTTGASASGATLPEASGTPATNAATPPIHTNTPLPMPEASPATPAPSDFPSPEPLPTASGFSNPAATVAPATPSLSSVASSSTTGPTATATTASATPLHSTDQVAKPTAPATTSTTPTGASPATTSAVTATGIGTGIGTGKTAANARKTPTSIVFTFREAEWEDVFQWLADLTGRTLLTEGKPSGKFNYYDTRSYSLPDAIDILNSVLLPKGFSLILRDNFLVVADLKDGIAPHLVERIPLEEIPTRGRTELVKVIVPLRTLQAEKAKSEFEPLKGPHGSVVSLGSSNQLLLVDTAKNVQQLVDLIKQLDSGEGKVDLRMFRLQYVSAIKVEQVVRELLGLSARSAANIPAPAQNNNNDSRAARMREMMMQRMMGGGGPSGPGGPGGGPPGEPGQPGGETKGSAVSIDERTNTLLVTTTPEKLLMVEQVVKELDVPQNEAVDEEDDRAPRVQVYSVSSGSAEGMVRVLATLFQSAPDTRISAHPDGNAVFVFATSREQKRVQELLQQLKTEGVRVEVIALRVLDAQSTVVLIKTLLGQRDEEAGRKSRMPFFSPRFNFDSSSDQTQKIAVEADTDRNRLIIRGTESQITELRELLGKLGEPNLASSSSTELGSGRFRVVPLGSADPRELSETLERVWGKLQPDRPLHIEVLGDDGAAAAQPSDRPTNELTPPEGRGRGWREDQGRPGDGERGPGSGRAPGRLRGPRSGSQPGQPGQSGQPDSHDSTALPPAVPTEGGTSAKAFLASVLQPVLYQEPMAQQARPVAPARVSNNPLAPAPVSGPAPVSNNPLPPAVPPRVLPLDQTEPSALAPSQREAPAPSAAARKPVTIVIGPDNLALASDDPEALAMAENLLNTLLRSRTSNSSGASFALYYLKAADAVEVSRLIDEALYGERSAFVIEDTTVRPRLIPDTRTNSLLIVGPPAEQRKIQQLIEILDREDPPESGALAQPTIIPVTFGSAQQVAQTIREVFAAQLYQTQPQQSPGGDGGRGGFFAAMMGGSQQRGSAANKLTIGVDEQTNSLIVSAPDNIIREVEELVKTLDDAARDNRRLARVVMLRNVKPEVVQSALGSLLGVKTSDPNKKSSSSSSTNANAPAPSPDQMRDFMRNRGGSQGNGNQGGSRGGGSRSSGGSRGSGGRGGR